MPSTTARKRRDRSSVSGVFTNIRLSHPVPLVRYQLTVMLINRVKIATRARSRVRSREEEQEFASTEDFHTESR